MNMSLTSDVIIIVIIIMQYGSTGKESTYNAGDATSFPGSGRSLEEEMETHSSTTWEILWTEEPGRPHSPWRHKRVGHVLATKPLPPQYKIKRCCCSVT